MKTTLPVIFTAFANAEDQQYLRRLKEESSALRDLLLPLEQEGRLQLLREESINNEDIPRLFSLYHQQLAIFHYGGHADGRQLHFEDRSGRVAGLADLLGLQENLKLVFLNGCRTQAQAKTYLAAGVPAVLVTTLPIPDEEAAYFARHFYQALAASHTIRQAFQFAKGALKAYSDAYDDFAEDILVCRGVALDNDRWEEMPWRLYVHSEKEEILDWRLPEPPDPKTPSDRKGMQIHNYGPVKNQINNPNISGDLNIS